MNQKKKPTSVLLNERNKLAAELYRACADGRVNDIRKLKIKFNLATDQYNKRIKEEEELLRIKKEKQLEKEAAKQAKLQAKLERQRLREEKRLARLRKEN